MLVTTVLTTILRGSLYNIKKMLYYSLYAGIEITDLWMRRTPSLHVA